MSNWPAKFLLTFVFLLILVPARGERLSGTPEIEQALTKLNVLGSVLMIGAHPDDENTAVLAYLARGRHLRTSYLSLTRGEGGQNLIGAEQGDLLGMIRTQELLAARQIDGAGQFFTRAIDFGYSKSAEEAMAKWRHDQVLADTVWVIRRFRPDVIVLRFSGTPRDGHGQHQASAIVGREAFQAAADPQRFPEQLRFVQPWQARRLVWNLFSFTPVQQKQAAETPGRLEIDPGAFNPVLGESYTEIAGMSRSMHRSQGMGAARFRGHLPSYFVMVEGAPASGDLFEGIDVTWKRLPGGAAVEPILAEALREFRPQHPEKSIPALVRARALIQAIHDPWAREKLAELDEAIGLCAGLWLDAAADRYAALPGSTVRIRCTALNRSGYPLALDKIRIEGMGEETAVDEKGATLGENRPVVEEAERRVPAWQPYTQPFWLERPRNGDLYEISDQKLIGVADNPPVLRAHFELAAGSTRFELVRPVRYRYVDHVIGELTRPLVVAPPVAINIPDAVVMFPDARPRTVQIAVEANEGAASGDVRLTLESGWTGEPAARHFQLSHGEQRELSFQVTPPDGERRSRLRASARVDGREIRSGMQVIAYPHIPAQTVFPPASASLVRADVRVTAHKVGYVMGAGDQMPEALRQLGLEVTLLGASDLAERDFSGFDAIVTGVRAYNVRADLRANQPRLLEYVHNGGTLVVQYNVAEPSLERLGPYPFTLSSARVAVEEAPVSFPNPQHPLLEGPNRITERDFRDWVQERGLYFASQWDAHYQPVLESHDPGEKPQEGGMLYTRYGKGVYIFSGYSWFRQLPAGVPGAYRIFANLLSAK